MMLSTVLAMLGLVALYTRQSHKAGKLGLISFIVATIGTIMNFGHQWSPPFLVPVLAESVPDFLDTVLADTTTVLPGGGIT